MIQRALTVPPGPIVRDMHFTFPCRRCPAGVVTVGTGPFLQAGEDEMIRAMCAHAARVHGEPGPFTVQTVDADGNPVEVTVLV